MYRRHPFKKNNGFTLIEILVAMFIFAIISVILVTGLKSVINAESGTENHAKRLRQLQMALVLISRDLEQAVNRPILNEAGMEEAAFKGDAHQLTFTHTGLMTVPTETVHRSLERTQYIWRDHSFWRVSWSALDRAPKTTRSERLLLENVDRVNIEYLDANNHVSTTWISNKQPKTSLPKAVRIIFTLSNWGELSQRYVIPSASH